MRVDSGGPYFGEINNSIEFDESAFLFSEDFENGLSSSWSHIQNANVQSQIFLSGEYSTVLSNEGFGYVNVSEPSIYVELSFFTDSLPQSGLRLELLRLFDVAGHDIGVVHITNDKLYFYRVEPEVKPVVGCVFKNRLVGEVSAGNGVPGAGIPSPDDQVGIEEVPHPENFILPVGIVFITCPVQVFGIVGKERVAAEYFLTAQSGSKHLFHDVGAVMGSIHHGYLRGSSG